MYASEISSILKRNLQTEKYFLNVFGLDELPQVNIDKFRWLLVCNCCPANMPGMHWLALYKDDDVIEVFDSFGQAPESYNLKPFLESQKVSKYIYNSTQLQAPDSTVCGQYCLFFAFWRCHGLSFKSIIDEWFSATDKKGNDKFVNSFYEVMLK